MKIHEVVERNIAIGFMNQSLADIRQVLVNSIAQEALILPADFSGLKIDISAIDVRQIEGIMSHARLEHSMNVMAQFYPDRAQLLQYCLVKDCMDWVNSRYCVHFDDLVDRHASPTSIAITRNEPWFVVDNHPQRGNTLIGIVPYRNVKDLTFDQLLDRNHDPKYYNSQASNGQQLQLV